MTETDLFPPAGRADWEALATRSGRVPLSSLTAHSDDGFAVGPIYPAGDGAPLPGRAPGTRWVAAQRIDRGDTATVVGTIASAIAGGATGIVLVLADSATARGHGIAPDRETLAGICADAPLAGLHVRIDAGEAGPGLAVDLVPSLARTGANDVCFAFDPIATLAARGFLARPVEDHLDALLSLATAMDDAGIDGEALVADGRVWHDAGASEAQELAAVLATACAWLRAAEDKGLDLERVARRLGIILSADADQFLSIAKFRAAHQVLGRLFELLDLPPRTVRIHAETSWRMMSRRDPYLNMLRATGAAFAAGVAGADAVTVLPFALDGDGFADRMSRNIQSIALDEAGLFHVGDPGAGSGAIEALTGELAASAWNEFRAIEADGGMLAAVRSGSLQARVAAMRDDRLRRVGTRAIEIVGVNIHIDRSHRLPPAGNVIARPDVRRRHGRQGRASRLHPAGGSLRSALRPGRRPRFRRRSAGRLPGAGRASGG